MKTSPHFFFTNFVKENFFEASENPSSIRHAFNAVVPAAHLADHYWEYNKRHHPSKVSDYSKLNDFREYVNKETKGDFNDILSLANAYKHLYERSNQAKWTLSSPGVLQMIYFNDNLNSIGFNSEEEQRLVYTLIDGSQKDFIKTLENVIDFWDNFIT